MCLPSFHRGDQIIAQPRPSDFNLSFYPGNSAILLPLPNLSAKIKWLLGLSHLLFMSPNPWPPCLMSLFIPTHLALTESNHSVSLQHCRPADNNIVFTSQTERLSTTQRTASLSPTLYALNRANLSSVDRGDRPT